MAGHHVPVTCADGGQSLNRGRMALLKPSNAGHS
ncbi:hypothetical protein Ae505Ps2_4256 [Pseudonocardia sp. Ae505_Ps2]|nr:hypothetical protein Ae505Ps2_4256 [Pseudonocardia sp. Ae505_Ps2]